MTLEKRCKISLFIHHISFNGCVAMIQSLKKKKKKKRAETDRYVWKGMALITTFLTSHSPPSLQLNGAPLPRSATQNHDNLLQGPLPVVDMLKTRKINRDTHLCLSKDAPTKTLWGKGGNAGTANVGMTVSSLVMILFGGDEGGFFEIKNPIEWKNTVEFASPHSRGVYISTNDIVKGKLIKRTPWLLQPS